MSAYEWVTNTFLAIAGTVDITVTVVNDEEMDDDGNLNFRCFEFDSYNRLINWLRMHQHDYLIDDKHMLYYGTASGITIYVQKVE